jgi:hypothetical protein
MLTVTTGKLTFDPSCCQRVTVGLGVVRPIPRHQVGPLQGAAASTGDRRDRIDQGQQLGAGVSVCFGQNDAQRHALRVTEEVVLRPRLTAIGWVRSSFSPPCTARTLELSAIARVKSILSASRQRVSNTRCNRSHTPALCHACRYRQQLMPEPQPISCGSICQGMPDLSTNKMPLSAWRGAKGLRPGYRLRRRLGVGRSGSTIDHSSSSTSGCAIGPPRTKKMHDILPVNSSFC